MSKNSGFFLAFSQRRQSFEHKVSTRTRTSSRYANWPEIRGAVLAVRHPALVVLRAAGKAFRNEAMRIRSIVPHISRRANAFRRRGSANQSGPSTSYQRLVKGCSSYHQAESSFTSSTGPAQCDTRPCCLFPRNCSLRSWKSGMNDRFWLVQMRVCSLLSDERLIITIPD